MAPLPPCKQRYPFLRYQGLEYTDANIADFEERLERIYNQEIHPVQVVDFQISVRWSQEMFELEGESERMIPGKWDLHDYWRDISTDGDFLGPPPSYILIKDLVMRLCHRMMSHSIAGRSQAPEKVTVTDLFYLRGMDVGSILQGLTVIAPALPVIDMAELVSAPEAAKDAHVDDEGGQAVLAPVHAPQPPPPPVAARTMPRD
ncbi:hypothetical protein Tco_0524339 [Tanacetum coccineum]